MHGSRVVWGRRVRGFRLRSLAIDRNIGGQSGGAKESDLPETDGHGLGEVQVSSEGQVRSSDGGVFVQPPPLSPFVSGDGWPTAACRPARRWGGSASPPRSYGVHINGPLSEYLHTTGVRCVAVFNAATVRRAARDHTFGNAVDLVRTQCMGL